MAVGGFLGQGWAFPPRFDYRRGDVAMASGEQDIRESLQILFATMLRERVMLPLYGGMLEQLVFEPIGEPLFFRIEDLVREAILLYEPRIVVERVSATPDDMQDGRVNVLISYFIPQVNVRSSMVYPFYLLEGSNLRALGGD
jgi:phage baseplate assembly protein W